MPRDRAEAGDFALVRRALKRERFMNMASPLPDGECRECMWLPLCAGGCPHERLFHGQRRCLPYRDDPAAFALAVHGRVR